MLNFKFKKNGFTIAELLIVLTVIGVITVLTAPVMTGGINNARYKTAYKKAYAVLNNIAAQEEAQGNLPNKSGDFGASFATSFFNALNAGVKVKEYFGYADVDKKIPGAGTTYTKVKWQNISFTPESGGTGTEIAGGTTFPSPWIETPDGIAYSIFAQNTSCRRNSAEINSASGCYPLTILVDVNSVRKGPNTFEPQNNGLANGVAMKSFTGDRYYVYIGSDGAAEGLKASQAGARILNDIK